MKRLSRLIALLAIAALLLVAAGCGPPQPNPDGVRPADVDEYSTAPEGQDAEQFNEGLSAPPDGTE